jgi:hypothetical protein
VKHRQEEYQRREEQGVDPARHLVYLPDKGERGGKGE